MTEVAISPVPLSHIIESAQEYIDLMFNPADPFQPTVDLDVSYGCRCYELPITYIVPEDCQQGHKVGKTIQLDYGGQQFVVVQSAQAIDAKCVGRLHPNRKMMGLVPLSMINLDI